MRLSEGGKVTSVANVGKEEEDTDGADGVESNDLNESDGDGFAEVASDSGTDDTAENTAVTESDVSSETEN